MFVEISFADNLPVVPKEEFINFFSNTQNFALVND
jgi:hypothetical protein